MNTNWLLEKKNITKVNVVGQWIIHQGQLWVSLHPPDLEKTPVDEHFARIWVFATITFDMNYFLLTAKLFATIKQMKFVVRRTR